MHLFGLALLLAAAPAADLPSREEVIVALARWDSTAPRRVLETLDCRPEAADEVAGRPSLVLCRFSGELALPDGRRRRFGLDCAYLARDAERIWRIEYFPDAEFCDF